MKPAHKEGECHQSACAWQLMGPVEGQAGAGTGVPGMPLPLRSPAPQPQTSLGSGVVMVRLLDRRRRPEYERRVKPAGAVAVGACDPVPCLQ